MVMLMPFRACCSTQARSASLLSNLIPSLSVKRLLATHPNPVQLRAFSSTTTRQLRTTELQPTHFPSLKYQSDRLWDDIHSTASFGEGRRYGDESEETGLSRLTLSDSDKQARDWFVETTKSLGCEVTVDSIGNIFAIRPGIKNDVPATFVGSHLDSQPLGGRFDGVLGVCAGVEMLRVLDDNWIETEGPVGVVNWTNEEGARFPISMMGSGVWAGARDLQATYDLQEVSAGADGRRCTVKEELERIGYLGSTPAQLKDGGMRMAGHFELHIEQGPRLLSMKKKVAAVTGVQAYKWFEVHVNGQSCHSGTTPMNFRNDALYLASRLIHNANRLARDQYNHTRKQYLASVGIITASPGSVNTVADHVMFTLDIRAETDEELQAFETMIRESFSEMVLDVKQKVGRPGFKKGDKKAALDKAGKGTLSVEIRETFHSPAAKFDETAVGFVVGAARGVLGEGEKKVPRMISGAGHDSVNTARHCPTAMVFVPCKDGVSHHPEEWCEEEDCAVGTDVIIQSVLRFDQWRSEQGHFAG